MLVRDVLYSKETILHTLFAEEDNIDYVLGLECIVKQNCEQMSSLTVPEIDLQLRICICCWVPALPKIFYCCCRQYIQMRCIGAAVNTELLFLLSATNRNRKPSEMRYLHTIKIIAAATGRHSREHQTLSDFHCRYTAFLRFLYSSTLIYTYVRL